MNKALIFCILFHQGKSIGPPGLKAKRYKQINFSYIQRIGYKAVTFVIFAVSILSADITSAQNLESIGKEDALTVSGGINVNQVFYTASGTEDRRDPYNYFLSGNLNFNLYGWSAPFSFSYSNQNSTFQQPFNQYGLSPTYKWLTVHLGYRSMNFSRYTLGGHLFLGVGADVVASKKLKVSAMYGRLQKAVELDTTKAVNLPAYKRMGGGAKVTVGGSKHSGDFVFFRAADEASSLTTDPEAQGILPEENFVVSMGGKTTVMKGLTFAGEIAYSAITIDARSENTESGKIYDGLDFVFQPKVSSAYYRAMNAAVQYAFSKYTIGVAYERVDPGYRTLGAYFFNNDLENIALTHTARLLNQKLSLNARAGLQRNNLDDQELSTMNRLSGSLNVNYQVTPKFSTSAGYSNFSTVVNFQTPEQQLNQVTPYDNLDTLNYQQISQNATFGTNFLLGQNKERSQNLNVNFSYQQTDDEQGGKEQASGTQYYNVNAGYSLSLVPRNLTLSVAGNTNISQSTAGENLIFGPSFSVRKSLKDNKLAVSGTLSYNNSRLNGTLTSRVVNLRLGGNYTLLEKHQFTLNVTSVDRFTPSNDNIAKFRELVAELGYNYNFSSK